MKERALRQAQGSDIRMLRHQRAHGLFIVACLLCIISLSACKTNNSIATAIAPLDAVIIQHHYLKNIQDLEKFTKRLYARNPKYEKNIEIRNKKLNSIFKQSREWHSKWQRKPSHTILTAAFALETTEDRIYLLGLGLTKGLNETYGCKDKDDLLLCGLQIPLDRLQRYHFNLNQTNWRIKTYHDEKGELLFLSNGLGKNGYLNMGYEVLVTRISTRLDDDIFLRGGLPAKYLFKISTVFLSILL